MLRSQNTAILTMVFLMLGSATSVGLAATPYDSPPLRGEEFRMRRALADKTVSWLETADEAVDKECDKLAESLIALDDPSPLSYFVAAQSAWLRGHPQAALTCLNTVIDQHGDEQAPFDVIMPVKIAGRFWIATVARYSHSVDLARRTYETLLTILSEDTEENRGLMIVCYLHLAEIESDHLSNHETAISRLRKAEAIRSDPNGVDEGVRLMQKWLQYERIKLTEGKIPASRQLRGDPEMMTMPLLVSFHGNIMGLTSKPLAAECSLNARRNLVSRAVVKLVLEGNVSPIDKMCADFSLAQYYENTGNAPEAVKRYVELFERDVFVSPVAGLHAGRIKKGEGKAAESDDVLHRLVTRYPQWELLVKRSREEMEEEVRQ